VSLSNGFIIEILVILRHCAGVGKCGKYGIYDWEKKGPVSLL